MELPRVSFAVAMVLLGSLSSHFTIAEAKGKCTQMTPVRSVYLPRKCPRCCYGYVIIISRVKVQPGAFDMRITLGNMPYLHQFSIGGRYSKCFRPWPKIVKRANQVRVSYYPNGVLRITAYMCDDLTGPTAAGKQCSLHAYSSACPGETRSNDTCVYEVEKAISSAEKTTNAVQVGVATSTLIKALPDSTKVTHGETELKTVNYLSKSYVIIPAGYMFCTFTDAGTEKNPQAPTGFEWKCILPKFFFAKTTSGACCDHRPSEDWSCEKSICTTQEEYMYLPSRGVKSAPHSQACNLVLLMGVVVHIIVQVYML